MLGPLRCHVTVSFASPEHRPHERMKLQLLKEAWASSTSSPPGRISPSCQDPNPSAESNGGGWPVRPNGAPQTIGCSVTKFSRQALRSPRVPSRRRSVQRAKIAWSSWLSHGVGLLTTPHRYGFRPTALKLQNDSFYSQRQPARWRQGRSHHRFDG